MSKLDTREEKVWLVIREDGKVVWINTETHCLVRICGIEQLVLDDRRNGDE